jgi:hypothetical protein
MSRPVIADDATTVIARSGNISDYRSLNRDEAICPHRKDLAKSIVTLYIALPVFADCFVAIHCDIIRNISRSSQ